VDELYQPLGLASIVLWGMVTLTYLRHRRAPETARQRMDKQRLS
jgi:hypothetical protein